MQSPTVHAIVTQVSRRVSTLPLQLLQKGTATDGRATKDPVPNHPVARLLNAPSPFQSKTSYWMDATSRFLRHGRHFAYKARGSTGPIRRLQSLHPDAVEILEADNGDVSFRVTGPHGAKKDYSADEIHYVRGAARDGLRGDSPVTDMREAIALEIAAEQFGAAFFGGGAMPGMVFKFLEGIQGFKTPDEERKFLEDFQQAFKGKGRFTAMLMPKGMDFATQIAIENDKAQFLETRKHQRNVIAGGFGIPPYVVGDLERQTFNNAEQQAIGLVTDVILPIVKAFEDQMERDLLTDADRSGGIIIRFNLDAALRGDFKTRQEGLNIQRLAGVISANDWRENENMNPISKDDGGDNYYQQGPSGQTGAAAPPAKPLPTPTTEVKP